MFNAVGSTAFRRNPQRCRVRPPKDGTTNGATVFFAATMRMVAFCLLITATVMCDCSACPLLTEATDDFTGLTAEQANAVDDLGPLDQADPVFNRLLYRAAKVSPATAMRDALEISKTIDTLIVDPAASRFQIFHVQGRVRWVSPKKIAEPGPSGKGVVWLLVIETTGEDQVVVLTMLANSVPVAWQKNQLINQPIKATGFFWRLASPEEINRDAAVSIDSDLLNFDTSPVLIVDRPKWFPDAVSEQPLVSPAWLELAAAGYDIGLLDSVRALNSQPLKAADSKPFYELLATVDRLPKLESRQPSSAAWTLSDLLERPKDSIGQRVSMSGPVRQCIKVQTPSAADSESGNGIPPASYYQLSIFPSLEGQPINVRSDDTLTAYPRVAVTVCVAELPSGETESTMVDRKVHVAGIHYRFWKYPSLFAEQSSINGQIGPLVVAQTVLVVPLGASGVGHWPMLLLAVGLMAVIFLAWWYQRAMPIRNPQSRPDTVHVQNIVAEIDSTN